ncbi:MAG: hypothetical protein AAF514_01025 [Verrucomicrobiota bacterium]
MGSVLADSASRPPQYAHGDIIIPAAGADEAKRRFSTEAAFDYLESGAVAWSGQRQCVSCHTNGTYLLTAPSLVPSGGKADEGMRRFFVEELEHHELVPKKELRAGLRPTELAYIAAGLAQWDQHVSKERSPETARALSLMFEAQGDDGSYGNLDCWPPLESSRFHGATVALMAAAAAPGWVESEGPEVEEKWDKLVAFLRKAKPANDYQRALLLWAAARQPDLLEERRKAALTGMIRKHQQPDGGWSMRHFASPESWGSGNRAEKLRAEADFGSPASDGHMTGLAVVVLRETGVPADDPALQRAVQWLKTNQRASGRWWTRSLNTDKWHLITYSGTAYPLLALSLCGEL